MIEREASELESSSLSKHWEEGGIFPIFPNSERLPFGTIEQTGGSGRRVKPNGDKRCRLRDKSTNHNRSSIYEIEEGLHGRCTSGSGRNNRKE